MSLEKQRIFNVDTRIHLSSSPLLALPSELRSRIYECLFSDLDHLVINIIRDDHSMLERLTTALGRPKPANLNRSPDIALSFTCRQLARETLPYWVGNVKHGIFIRNSNGHRHGDIHHCRREIKDFCRTTQYRLGRIQHLEIGIDDLQLYIADLVPKDPVDTFVNNAGDQSFDLLTQQLQDIMEALSAWPEALRNVAIVTFHGTGRQARLLTALCKGFPMLKDL